MKSSEPSFIEICWEFWNETWDQSKGQTRIFIHLLQRNRM